MFYYVDPFGCAKNQVDAENMMAHLNAAGWSAVQDAADAEIVIVNSCGFIESAKQESINAVLNWKKLFPGKKILLAGCLAQRYMKELAESLPEADGFFGVDDITGIVDTVNAILVKREKGKGKSERNLADYRQSIDGNHNFDDNPLSLFPTSNSSLLPSTSYPLTSYLLPFTSSRPLLSLPGSAYVKISEGCDNRCAYCAIPLIRGPLRCRSLPDIVEECKGLVARGIKELCIIGQDIGSYRAPPGSGDDGSGLPELLNAIAGLEGHFWVRLLYMHPGHFPLPILDIIERDPRFLPYFDIPFQHASQKILSAMNRGNTAEEGLALVNTIRSKLPAAVIRTTFLAGFPGETDDDFAALLDFQNKLRPDWLGCFAFSREEDTPAYSMKGQVPKKIAAQRKLEIEKNQVPITEQNMDRFAGQTLDALLEEQFTGGAEDMADETLWLGRLYCHAPEVDGSAVIAGMEQAAGRAGEFVSCRVIARRGFDVECRVPGESCT